MTQEIINTLQMLVNENDPDMRTHYAVAINNHILELENIIAKLQKPKTCASCIHYTERLNVNGQFSYAVCAKEIKDCRAFFSCLYYQPKDNQ